MSQPELQPNHEPDDGTSGAFEDIHAENLLHDKIHLYTRVLQVRTVFSLLLARNHADSTPVNWAVFDQGIIETDSGLLSPWRQTLLLSILKKSDRGLAFVAPQIHAFEIDLYPHEDDTGRSYSDLMSRHLMIEQDGSVFYNVGYGSTMVGPSHDLGFLADTEDYDTIYDPTEQKPSAAAFVLKDENCIELHFPYREDTKQPIASLLVVQDSGSGTIVINPFFCPDAERTGDSLYALDQAMEILAPLHDIGAVAVSRATQN